MRVSWTRHLTEMRLVSQAKLPKQALRGVSDGDKKRGGGETKVTFGYRDMKSGIAKRK